MDGGNSRTIDRGRGKRAINRSNRGEKGKYSEQRLSIGLAYERGGLGKIAWRQPGGELKEGISGPFFSAVARVNHLEEKKKIIRRRNREG